MHWGLQARSAGRWADVAVLGNLEDTFVAALLTTVAALGGGSFLGYHPAAVVTKMGRSMGHVHVGVDTNIFLHFGNVEELKWEKKLTVGRVERHLHCERPRRHLTSYRCQLSLMACTGVIVLSGLPFERETLIL